MQTFFQAVATKDLEGVEAALADGALITAVAGSAKRGRF